MTYRKKLIEVALPLEAINKASAREKSIRHGHPSTLHLWWARRPLAAARAVIFTSLVDDPDDPNAPPAFVEACKALPKVKNALENDTPRMRLFDFIERLVLWESTTDEAVLETARELILLSTDGNPPPLLDPFAGGGSIPLEAQRLGLEAHASDLNPVAVMINKAMIEIPPRFANQPPVNPTDREQIGGDGAWKGAAGLAADVRYYGQWMRERAWEKIGHLYPTHNDETVIAWLWARTVQCPNPACGARMPLIKSFELSKKKGKRAWIVPHIDKATKTVSFSVERGEGQAPDPPKIGRGAKFKCIVCDEAAPDKHLKSEGMAGRLGAQMTAIVTKGQSGRSYYAPSQEQSEVATSCGPDWTPSGDLPDDPRNVWCKIYGFEEYSSLFTPRQLVALTTFSDLVAEGREQARQDAVASGLPDDDVPLRDGGQGAYAYGETISVYLAFTVDRSTDFWGSLAVWANQPKNELVAHVFGRQAIPMVWDYAEANPFSSSGGNWLGNLNYVAKGIESLRSVNQGHAIQQDATKISMNSPVAISTDPPYYDNIGYADLSDYFYVWLRKNLRSIYPEIFGTMLVPKEPELVATPYRFGGDRNAANEHFENGLFKTFHVASNIVSNSYPVTIYYAFKQSEKSDKKSDAVSSTGWETMLEGLVKAGFLINGTWPVRSERTVGLKGSTNMLASSIVLVCRPRPDDAAVISRRDFVNLLRQELPNALREMQSGNIAPVDLAQAAIGPGMAVYSRHKQVLEANGDPLTVRAALQLINQELDSYLSEQEGDVDGDTRFAIAWFEQNGFDEAEFGVADTLARAKNTSVAGMVQAGIVASGRGKVNLRHWQDEDWPDDWDPADDDRTPIWEATHQLICRLENLGESGTARLRIKMSDEVATEARQLAYRLYSICERKGWSDHARAYNGLVISWPMIQEEVTRIRQEMAEGAPTEQGSLFGE